MHVHIHPRRIDPQKQKRQRITPLRQRIVIRLQQRIAQRPAFHRPRIHERQHLVPRRPPRRRHPDKPRQPQIPLLRRHRQKQRPQTPPEQFPQPLPQIRTSRRLKNRPPVFDYLERHSRMGDRVQPHTLDNMRRLRRVRLQKLPPRRHRIEKLPHLDPRPHRHSAFPHMHEFPPVHQNLRPVLRLRRPRLHRKTRNARDRRQRLPPKPESPDPHQILRLRDLARRVPFQRKQRVALRHPRPVVLHPDIRPPPLPKLHLHPSRPGVQTILQQLLHHRCRPLDHLARGDLIGKTIGQYANSAHKKRKKLLRESPQRSQLSPPASKRKKNTNFPPTHRPRSISASLMTPSPNHFPSFCFEQDSPA